VSAIGIQSAQVSREGSRPAAQSEASPCSSAARAAFCRSADGDEIGQSVDHYFDARTQAGLAVALERERGTG
jgi:hypothetical protein